MIILTVSELEILKIQILKDIASGVAMTIITNISNNQSIDIKQRIRHLSQEPLAKKTYMQDTRTI